jgi:ribosomal protein S18 acetylase RimI-like enzyme
MIRASSINDLASLIALFIEENAHNNSVAPDRVSKTNDVLTLTELQEFIDNESSYLWVYESDGKIVGLILATHHRSEVKRWKQKRNFVYLDELVVTENYRGRGIASLLIQSLTEWSKRRGADCIDLHVWQANTKAKALYQKLGFNEKQLLMTLPIDS